MHFLEEHGISFYWNGREARSQWTNPLDSPSGDPPTLQTQSYYEVIDQMVDTTVIDQMVDLANAELEEQPQTGDDSLPANAAPPAQEKSAPPSKAAPEGVRRAMAFNALLAEGRAESGRAAEAKQTSQQQRQRQEQQQRPQQRHHQQQHPRADDRGRRQKGKGANKDGKRKNDKMTVCSRILRGKDCHFGHGCWYSHCPKLLAAVRRTEQDFQA